MRWRAGANSGHYRYEIHDELVDDQGFCVAVLECFANNPDTYYCNALTPEGKHVRIGSCTDFAVAKDWAERVTGLKANYPILGPQVVK